MDRRLGGIAAALAAVAVACGGDKAESDGAGRTAASAAGAAPVVPAAGAPSPAAGAPAVPVPEAPSAAALAAVATAEPEVAPITAADILSGPAAEAVIATQRTPGIDAGTGEDAPPRFIISPLGVGAFRLGMTRADVAELVKPAAFRKVPRPAGEPSLEIVTVTVDRAPIMQLRVLGARVTELQVIWRDGRAITDGEVLVGATFLDAENAHGDPRRVRDSSGVRGWVYSELPGVVFAPADPTLLTAETPPPEGRIGRIIVVGPENLSAAD